MIRETRKSTGGTSFHGTVINAKVGTLKTLFPNSYYEQNDGMDKSNYDFTLELEDGDVFTIYDWKEYRPLDDNDVIEFHIGGFNKDVTEKAKEALQKMISDFNG